MANLEQIIAVLRRELAQLTAERDELLTERDEAYRRLDHAQTRETATAEVLKVINLSPDDLSPVFDAILQKAHSLRGVEYGSLQLYDGEKLRAVAVHSLPEPLAGRLREGYTPGPSLRPLFVDGADFTHITDIAALDEGVARVATVEGQFRTLLIVALRKDGRMLGQIVAGRKERCGRSPTRKSLCSETSRRRPSSLWRTHDC